MKIRGIWVIDTLTGERRPAEEDDERLQKRVTEVVHPIIIKKLRDSGIILKTTE